MHLPHPHPHPHPPHPPHPPTPAPHHRLPRPWLSELNPASCTSSLSAARSPIPLPTLSSSCAITTPILSCMHVAAATSLSNRGRQLRPDLTLVCVCSYNSSSTPASQAVCVCASASGSGWVGECVNLGGGGWAHGRMGSGVEGRGGEWSGMG